MNVPGPNATWAEIEAFALTFDGYKRFGPTLGELSSKHSAAGTVPEDLDELRGCLFIEQRRWRHFQSRPDERGMRYIRALIEGIRRAVADGRGGALQGKDGGAG